jgi:hypothetical protein
MDKIEFGDLESARQIRQSGRFTEYLSPEDDGRKKVVKIRSDMPPALRQRLEGEAADSRKFRAFEFGQEPLTRQEKQDIDFNQTDIFTARSAKAVAVARGVDDFTAFFDPTLTVSENKQIFEDVRRNSRGGGQRGGRDFNDSREQDRRAGRGSNRAKESRVDNAKEFAFAGDREAQEFLTEEAQFGDVFDLRITETSTGFRGSGEDFDRVLDTHESRSERAQTIDEKHSAPTTRNPFEWVNNTNRLDFPGVDTVDVDKLHQARSKQAREVDEREVAPIADSKEEWAAAPESLDWPGVDIPEDQFLP